MSTQGRRAVFWLLQEAPSCSFPLLLGTPEEEQTQGCSSCSSALRPHLETPGEKTEMLKYHMGRHLQNCLLLGNKGSNLNKCSILNVF